MADYTLGKRVLAAIGAVIFVVVAFTTASSIRSDWRTNEDLADSAPQESVVAGWAVKDAAITGLQLLGALGGLVIFSLSILTPGTPATERSLEEQAIARHERKRCPACFEPVRVEARLCRYCRTELAVQEPVAAGPPAGPPSQGWS